MSACNINLSPKLKQYALSLCDYIIKNPETNISSFISGKYASISHKMPTDLAVRNFKYIESKLKQVLDPNLVRSEIQKCYEQYLDLQSSVNPDFFVDDSLSFNTNLNNFIRLIDNPTLNSELYLKTKAEFTLLLLNSVQTNRAIGNLVESIVNSYIQELSSYVSPGAVQGKITKDGYIELMTQALLKAKRELGISLNNPTHISKVKQNKQHLEILRKIHVLNNFDNLLEHFLGVVNITPSLKGKIVYVDKYNITQEGLMNKGYGDDSSKSDSNNIQSKLLLLMWNTIPDGNGGFLNKKDFEYIIQKLNQGGNLKYNDINDVIYELEHNTKDFGLKGINVAHWLRDQKNQYDELLRNSVQLPYRKNLEHYFNFTDTFMYQILVRNNVAYTSTDSNGTTVKQPEIYHKDKSYVYNGLLNTLLDNIVEKGNLTFVTYSEYLALKNYPITSRRYINFLNKITGLHLTVESMSRILSENELDDKGRTPEETIKDFVHTYVKGISALKTEILSSDLGLSDQNALQKTKEAINDFIQKRLVFNPAYIAFSDIIVKNNYDAVMKVLDLKGNQQANSAIPNNFLKLHENVLLLNKALLREGYINILVEKNKFGLVGVSRYIKKDRSDVYDKYCYSAYRGAVQIDDEIIDHEKLTSEELLSLSFNYEFIDSACKDNTIFLQPICYADKTRIGLTGFNAKELINDFALNDGSLLRQVALQRKGYYLNLKENIISRYNNVFKKDFKTLEEVLTFIKNNLDIIASNIHQLRDGIDIVKTESDAGKPLYVFNYLQYQFMADAHKDVGKGNIDKLLENAKELFKVGFAKVNIPKAFKDSSYLNNNKAFLYSLFELTSEAEWDEFTKAVRSSSTWANLENVLAKKTKNKVSISDKYFYISNLGSDAILQSAGLVFTSYGDSKLGDMDIKVFDESKVKTLLSANFVKGTKRHNFFTASYQAPLVGTKYGVRQYSKYLVVEDLSLDITNYYGDVHSQEVHDGAIFACALQTYWELNSYPELDYGETMKVIGLMPSGFTARQIKCAQYSISNWKIRQGFDNNDPKVWNLRKLNERLLKSGVLSNSFINNLLNSNISLSADIAINENGVFYLFLGFLLEENGEVSTLWLNEDGVTIKRTQLLKTAYDLWLLLGAEWSYSLLDGDYVESENSMKLTADLISEFSPETKENMITKIIPKAAFKTGLENIHSIDLVYDDNFELLPIQWNNEYLGIQQDYDHEADDSEVPSLTQLISNVAFNGANVELVNQIWDTLSFLIQRSLKKYDYLANDGADLDTVHKRIAKMMLEKIQSSNTTSNNLTKLLEEAIKGNGLVISDQSLFYKFASDLMALLNHTSIKSKSRGIAIIQNPSHGLLGIYEDANGGTLMEEDVRRNPIEVTETDVDVNELAIEDIVTYDGLDKPMRISNIHDLRMLLKKLDEDGIKLRKVHNVKRNLKSPTLTYKVMENGKEVTKSWWLAPWTLERWEAEAEYKKNPTKANALRVMRSKRWYLANLKAIENNTLFLTEDLNNPILIISYNYTGGEQILPKVLKTKYGLKNNTTLHEVLSRGEEFFIELFNEIYKKPEEVITSYTQGEFSLGFFFKDYNVYYTENTQLDSTIKISLNENNTIIEDNNRWYIVNGKKLFIIPSDIDVIYKDGNNFVVNARVTGDNADNNFIQNLTEQEGCKGALAYFKNKVTNTKNKTIKYVLNSFNPFNYNTLYGVNGLDAVILLCASQKLKSFKLTLDTISVRIPTQAFQSFMRNTTVGFTNSDSNDGYINLMQIWFTGGDYDIDKSYTLMYDTDENGVILTTSNLYKKGLDIDKCFDLPLPDNSKNINLITTDESLSNGWDVIFNNIGTKIINDEQGNRVLDALKAIALDYVDCNTSYELFKEALSLVNNYNNELHINIVNNSKETQKLINLINDLNTHNNTNVSKAALQNRITNGLIRCSGNVNNMQASQQPMTSGEIKELIDDCEKELENFDKTKYSNFSKTFDIFNPTAKWEILQEAIVGKGDVGITANGIKVDSQLQLYYNDYYKTWNPNEPLDDTYRVDVPLNIKIKNKDGIYKTIISKRIVRFGDTVLDADESIAFEKFKLLYKDISDEDLAKEKDYKILKRNKPVNKRERKTCYSYEVIIGNQSLTRETYLKWLFEKEKLDTRISDNLSVFISLAVDNMKEMQLARIYGNEELLKVPLTLIMLGVDPYDVMLFCKTMLKPVYEALSVNRYNTKKEGLTSLIGKALNNKNPLLLFSQDVQENNYLARQFDSILKIADNTTLLAKVFKINQGLTATYGDLVNELTNLSISLSDSNNLISLGELFLNPDFTANIKKQGFDIIDVIKKSRYFKTMHEAALKQLKNINSVASRAFVHKELSKNALGIKKKKDRDNAIRNYQYLYDHYIIGKTLLSLTLFTFTKESLEKGLGLDLKELPIIYDKPFALNSNDNLELFTKVVEDYLIPKLQKLYPNNYAIQSFVKTFSKRLNKNIYDLPFNNLDTNNIEEQENLKKAIAEFSLIANNNSGLINIAQQPITIIDALNVYQMITKRDSISAFKDMVTENSVMGKNLVYTKKNTIIKNYDDSIYNHMTKGTNISEELVLELLNNTELINAVKGESNTINLEKALIWTLEKPKSKLTRKLFLDTLINKGIKVEESLFSGLYIISFGDYRKIHHIPEEVDAEGVANEIISNYEAWQFINNYINNVQTSPELKEYLQNTDVYNIISSLLFPDKSFVYNTITLNNNLDYLQQPSYILESNNVVKMNFTNNSPSNNEVIYTLLNHKFGDSIAEHVKFLLETLSDDKLNIIDSYTEYYLNNNITKLDLHNAVLFLQNCNLYLESESVFYEKQLSMKDATSLQEGDLIEIGSETYVFAGKYNKNTKLINVHSGEILYSKDSLFNAKKLRIPFGTLISSLLPSTDALPLTGNVNTLPINSTFELKGTRYRVVYKFITDNNRVETIVVSLNKLLLTLGNASTKVQYNQDNTDKTNQTTLIIEGMKHPEKYIKYIQAGDVVVLGHGNDTIKATVITVLKDGSIRLDKLENPVKLSSIRYIELSTRLSSAEFTHEAYNDIDNENVQNFEKFYTPLKHEPGQLHVGDIIKRNQGLHYNLYKVVSVTNEEVLVESFVCDKKTTHRSIDNLRHGIKVFDPKEGDIYYTKDKATIYNDNVDASAKPISDDLSISAKATLFIGHLLSLGLQVKYSSGNTRFEGDTIYINRNAKEDVLYLLMHEATHLALANLKLNSREAYLYLLDLVKKINDPDLVDLFNAIDNDNRYPTEIDKLEEKLIRYMDIKIKGDFIKSNDFNDKDVFTKYLKLSLYSMGMYYGPGEVLPNLILNNLNLNKFNLEKVTQDKVIDKVLNKVKRICD